MRVLFTIDHLYLHGGAEKVLIERANYFAEIFGYEVHLLTTEQNGHPVCYPLNQKVKLTDIAINYSRSKSYFHPVNIAKIPRHYSRLKKAIKSIRPDVVIALNYAFDFYFLPMISAEIPKAKEYHSSGFAHFEASKRSALKKIFYAVNDHFRSRYDRIILLNPDERQYYPKGRSVVIPNPISLSDIEAELESEKVISAGRIAHIKGFDNLIKAWEIVHSKESEWELHIYGQGLADYIAQLQDQIKTAGLQHRVFINAAVPNLREAMAEFSVYAMSSHSECFPMVLLESLSVGLPIVSFNCPTGPRNIITDGSDGFLTPDQDVEALADKIVLLMRDFNLRKTMGKNAKENVKRFSKDSIMNKWREMLEGLTDKNRLA